MPIYEFYCGACHTLFNFLSKRIDTASCPPCPRCRRTLSRQVSLVAATRAGSGGDDGANGDPPVDETRMEQAMERMAGKIEGLDEENPRQAAQVMREFAAASGLRFNASVEEALSRMEAGEDPEAIESELGEALEGDNPFASSEVQGSAKGAPRHGALRRDPTLYEM
jgi:putative FmdB family regulatory protein